jgi:hypothetical protein
MPYSFTILHAVMVTFAVKKCETLLKDGRNEYDFHLFAN